MTLLPSLPFNFPTWLPQCRSRFTPHTWSNIWGNMASVGIWADVGEIKDTNQLETVHDVKGWCQSRSRPGGAGVRSSGRVHDTHEQNIGEILGGRHIKRCSPRLGQTG